MCLNTTESLKEAEFLMKKMCCPITLLLIFFLSINPHPLQSMPGADNEGNEEASETSPAASAPSSAPNTEQKNTTDSGEQIPKPTPLKWPATTELTEDNKKLLQTNNKEIVQLFTLSQEVCKNMDDVLGDLNTQRDAASSKYRETTEALDQLFQRISAVQADKK